jgi:DNA-binding IclR family transcriptional regulator
MNTDAATSRLSEVSIASVGAEKPSHPGANRAPAVTRAFNVLRVLASERKGLGVTEISRRVGLVPSTCLHVLRALVAEGAVSFNDQEKTYRTSVGLLALVREAMAHNEYPRAVQPIIDDISLEHEVTCVAFELDGRDRVVVVANSRSSSIVSLHVSVGSRFPALISATGRLVAASRHLSRDELKRRFDELHWENAPKFEVWAQEVEQAGAEGIAVERGNLLPGLTVVSTLLPAGSDGSVRGIALIGFEHHLTDNKIRELKATLRDAAGSLSSQLN